MNAHGYHEEVIGMQPTEQIPCPAAILCDYLRYEKKYDLLRQKKRECNPPLGYIPLAERTKMPSWPKDKQNWPLQQHEQLFRRFPCGFSCE